MDQEGKEHPEGYGRSRYCRHRSGEPGLGATLLILRCAGAVGYGEAPMGARDRAITLARLRMSVLLEVAVGQFRLGLERPAPVGAGFFFLAQRLQRDTQ